MLRKRAMQRIAALGLCAIMITAEASAVVKEVELWGARSINDMGSSDRLITMDELQEDYSGYLQTDGMTEYFHKDRAPSPKTDMNEALAWLIDNQIISRDETITVSNINNIPSVNIVKSDINSKMFYSVHRSDALMYIYKSVFGPLNGRTVGVETPSVRSDNGTQSLFSSMIAKYAEPAEQEIYGESIAGNGSQGGSGSGVGGPGAPGGVGENSTNYTNDAIKWRYTPQGDEYTSVFGDTNVFISENHFNQEAYGGDGGRGGDGVSGGSLNSGTGGPGGAGGQADNTINYETDYKQIYFVPGSDILFYRTDDVVEMYLQALLTKGLLSDDTALRTTKFEDTFVPLTADGAPIAAWSGEADPYVVNLSIATHVRIEDVASVRTADVLGTNYSVRNNGSSMTITRSNLFNSNTGYFSTEELTRMDVYRYIYTMVYANEKKLSDLERDIVNYKYGMEFDGIANEADTDVLKYLIAKGILDFNGSNELTNLYSSISWYDFIPILYRVANPNARLDFSVIQLTDSEQSWRARGFSPQTVQLVEAGAIGDITVTCDDGYLVEQEPQDTSFVQTVAEILGITTVEAAPAEVGTITYRVENSGAMTFAGYYFDFQGATYNTESLLSSLEVELASLDTATYTEYLAQVADGYDAQNPKHRIVANMLRNVYVMALIRNDGALYNQLNQLLTEWKNTRPSAMTSEVYQAKSMVGGYFLNMLECARTGEGAPSDIVFVMNDGTRTNVPIADSNTFATNLKSVSFTMPQSGTGVRETYNFEFTEGSAGALIQGGTDVVTAVNKSAVEFTRRFTEAEVQSAGSTTAIQTEMTKQLGSTRTRPMIMGAFEALAANSSPAFQQQVDPTGKEAFVSWQSIEQAMASSGEKVPLVKVSDSLLYNTETDTYAYFSNASSGGKAVALVGTAVVTGDSDLGVMFKSGDGESATIYYHVNAIRLLLNAGQEGAVIGGVRSMDLPTGNLESNVTSIPLVSESGVSESSIAGVRVLISRDYSGDSANFGSNSAFGQSTQAGNTAWGDYLSLSQANRVMNIISRRIRYTSTTGVENCTAYATVRFVPVDAEELGTVAITSNSSLQDLLDAPAQAPSDPAAKQVWTQNKAACNAYANWIYGTSNVTYIETGYVRPVATVYLLGEVEDTMLPVSLFTPLSDSQIASVTVVPMGKVMSGAVTGLATSPTEAMADTEANRASYWLATDCSAIVSCDRLYLHSSLLSNMSINRSADDGVYARISNLAAKQAVFTPGSTFKVAGVPDTLANGMAQPDIMVVGTSEDGTVTCQVGPIVGTPVSFGSTKAVIYAAGNPDAVRTLADYDITSNTGDNRLVTTYYEMFKSMVGVKNLGVTAEPVFTAAMVSRHFVFTGTQLNVYERGSRPLASVAVPSASSTDTMASYNQSIRDAVSSYSSAHPNLTYTYLTISFPAANFRVRDGKLEYKPSSATEFLSPSLFSSLNDLIIDEMINESNGAIPVNEIPAGSLLKIGNCYYQAVGTSAQDKSFVGYAFMNSTVTTATLQDAASAFGNQFIRAGNQYMNVSHWFAEGTQVLGDSSDEQMEALASVADQTLKVDNTAKRSVDANGNVEVIVSSLTGSAGSLYCPIKIVFTDGLLAYKVSAPGETGSDRYQLCTSAENSVAGIFSDLPFFTNRILDAELYDQTTDLLSATFNRYEGASSLMVALQEQFQRAFAGDLITLARMLVFIILCWLVIASWICYVCRVANLLPILEAIRYPTGNRNSKGLDLLKLVSLGTINLDTEFGLGRFIQYEVILAVLLCVVMLTGNITV